MPKQKIKIREVDDGIDGAPPWITTFVDMVSLLVTFFILLYTFSSIREFDTFTYPKNIISTSGIFEGDSSDTIDAPADDLMLAMDLMRGSRKRHTRPVNELRKNMEEMGQRLTDEHVPIDLRTAGDGLHVTFPVDAGFRPGDDRVNAALVKALVELADTIQYYPLMVVVEGTPTTPSSRPPAIPTRTPWGSPGPALRRASWSARADSIPRSSSSSPTARAARATRARRAPASASSTAASRSAWSR